MTRLSEIRPGRSGRFAALALVSLFAASAANAQITSIASPFTGSLSESFESFPNFVIGPNFPNYLATPTSVFGGSATFTGSQVGIVYEPGSANYNIGTSGFAQVADGVKSFGLNGTAETGVFTFASPISDFGGFWGASTNVSDPVPILVSFFDAANTQIGATQSFNYSRSGPRDGLLIWQGWSSSTPITSVRFTSRFLGGDAFQANAAIVPEPSEWATLGFAALGIGALTLRARRA